MWRIYKRPTRERKIGLFPGINIHRGGMQLNKMACAEMGIGVGDVKYFVMYEDEKNPNRFGFRVLNTPQSAEIENVYKVVYREDQRTAKVNSRQFIENFGLLERAMKLDKTTFPLEQEESEGEVFWFFELK